MTELNTYSPKNLNICTLLFKKEKYTENINIRSVGKIIPNTFVIEYSLDCYNFGINLDSIYSLIE